MTREVSQSPLVFFPSFSPRTISLVPYQLNAVLYYLNVWNRLLFTFSYTNVTKLMIQL